MSTKDAAYVEDQRQHWEGDHSKRRPWNHPSVRALFEPRAQWLLELLGADATVLDVGCGNGFLTLPLEQRFKRVVGLDFAAAMLAINPAREKVQGDATKLPFADGSFDAVVCSHLLHHMPPEQQEAAAREMARVAKRLVVIWEPNRSNPAMWLFSVLVPHEQELLRFPRSRPRELLRGAGLERATHRSEGLITPNLCPPWLVPIARMLEKTPLRALGMYVRAVGHKPGAGGGTGVGGC